jgi:uncharacterized protein YbjT (DUF2867 family)
MDRGVIVVTGASGLAGPHVVSSLVQRGAHVRGLGRKALFGGALPGIEFELCDVHKPSEIDNSLRGAGTVVHCATNPDKQVERAMVRDVYEAARRAHVRHFVYIGIVGIDQLTVNPYFAAKLEGEKIVTTGDLPWTVQRATQFHEFVPKAAAWWAKDGEIVLAAGARWRTISARAVGTRLADLALGPPRGRVPDIGGPEVRTLVELIAAYHASTGKDVPIREKPGEGPTAGLGSPALLGAPDIEVLGCTYDEWLKRG